MKRVIEKPNPRLISETPELYRDYIIFIKNKDKLYEAVQPIIHPLPTPHRELFNAAINTLQGIDSNVCLMDSWSSNFRVNDFIASDTYSTTPLVSLFKRFAKIGSCYSKLEKVSSYLQTGDKGTIGIALGVALNEVLCLYLANVIHFGPPKINPDDVTLLNLYSHFHPYFIMIEGLGKIFHCLNTAKDGKWEPYLISLQSGLDLLLYIQDTTVGIVKDDPLHNTMCYLLTEASTPLLTYIQHWIFHGQVNRQFILRYSGLCVVFRLWIQLMSSVYSPVKRSWNVEMKSSGLEASLTVRQISSFLVSWREWKRCCFSVASLSPC